MRKRVFGWLMVGLLAFACVGAMPQRAAADAVIEDEDTSFDRYIAFGADLNKKEKAAVLSGFGISEKDVEDYKTVEITNQEEHARPLFRDDREDGGRQRH